MKPSFALNLSPDGIALLHRTARGWIVVGEVPLDSPDLAEAMAYLRTTALGLEPRGVTTKLVLPASQVLYREVEAPGATPAERRKKIEAALEGMTPYPVRDLAYAWSGDGPRVKVAVVARETLQEAESFALEHRFNPVCFVAMPEDGTFFGEPFFGETEAAPALLAGEKLARDDTPVQIVGRTALAGLSGPVAADDAPPPYAPPKATPARETTATLGADETELPFPEPAASKAAPAGTPAMAEDNDPAEALAATERRETQADPDLPPEAEAPADEAPVVEAASPVDVAKDPALGDHAPPRDAEPDEAPFADLRDLEPEDEADAPVASIGALRAPGRFLAPDEPAPFQPAPPQPAPPQRPRPSVTDPVIQDDPLDSLLPDGPDTSAPPPMAEPTFTSRRSAGAAPRLGAARPAGRASMPDAVRAAMDAHRERTGGGRPTRPVESPRMPAPERMTPPPLTAAPAEPASLAEPTAPPQPTPTPAPGMDDQGRPHTRFLPNQTPEPRAAVPQPATPQTPTAPQTPPPVAPPRPTPVRQPAAAKAVPKPTTEAEAMTVFGARRKSGAGTPRYLGLILTLILLVMLGAIAVWSSVYLSQATPRATAKVAAVATATTDTAAQPPPQAGQSATTTTGATQPSLDPTKITATADVSSQPGDPAPKANLTAAKIGAPSTATAMGSTITLASVDPKLSPTPRPRLTGAGNPSHDAPPVLATQGAPAASPQSPAATAPPTATVTSASIQQTAATAQANAPPALPVPAVATVAPKARPQTAAAPAPSGPTMPAIRPQPRPTTGAFATPSAAPAGTAGVTASLRPQAPPPQLIALRKAAASRARQAGDTGVKAAVTSARAAKAAPAPQQNVKPSKPSVRKEATMPHALNLKKVNLLGVFGKSDNPMAIVRLPNGRVVKVHVGDRLDGGRVAAIGENTLYYVKNGRNIQLSLPK